MLMALPPDYLTKAIAGMEALAKNGLRYPFPQYGIQQDVRAGLAVSYPGRQCPTVDGHREEDMPFIASNGLTEAGTSKTIPAGGMNVHYHDIGSGEPVLFLHSYGPGTTAWITFHKVVGALSQHFRCILMDLPNFSKTGPIVYQRGRARGAGADRGGACWMRSASNRRIGSATRRAGSRRWWRPFPIPSGCERFVMGGSHIGTGGDRYLMANRPSEGSRATRQARTTRAGRTSAAICACTSMTRAW